MASVISGADYLVIATDYSNARDQTLGAVEYLFDAVYHIVLLQDIVQEVDLLQEFWNSYQINTDILRSPVTLLNAVRILNSHVLNRDGTATNLDEYFDAEGIMVPATWANLCAAAGYSIDETNISA